MASVYWPLNCPAMYCLLSICHTIILRLEFVSYVPVISITRVLLKNNLRPVSRKPAQKDHGKWHSPVDDDKQDET